MLSGSSLEPISFKCDACRETSPGMLDFKYDTVKRYTREWVIEEEWEYTPGFANCKKCGHRNDVWPKRSFERRWSKRYGKA